MEKELKRTKRLNRAAAALIAVLLILMGLMLVNMKYLARQYEHLEKKYIQLYEEMEFEDKTALHDGKETGERM